MVQWWRAAVAMGVVALVASRTVHASLSEPGFRAVGVAYADGPMSSLAVAPDGRLFAAVQAHGQTVAADPGSAEIRVYTTYATTDGSTLDRGSVWATVDGVRATTNGEGLLGLALAPDFATSKLVYVYLTTTDEAVNQHVRVYRENADGLGEYLGTVQPSLEPPTESSNRNGGGLGFGADGCLYVGVGDNGGGNRWNAQLLVGTDPIQSAETTALCTSVCLGPAEYPARTITNDGAPNDAGKVLRLAVEGPSPAQAGDDPPLAAQPLVFGAGLRNPAGLVTHPLTGQVFVTDRGESTLSEIDVVESGTNHGWPCLDGDEVAGNAACLVGHLPDEVYANHAAWRRAVAVHAGSNLAGGPAVYTGLAYPAQYFGDLFYVLRDGTRIYRLDLSPPCFLPDPAGTPAVAFHDSTDNGDFLVSDDFDGDGQIEERFFPVLVALAQGPDPLGRQVLYVAGKHGDSSALTDDTVVFRIEYATAATPYAGPTGRVADECFATTGWENPFHRPTCLPPGGPCPGAADGAPCGDADACNGPETCQAGVCRHGAAPAEGTACSGADQCHAACTCVAGTCTAGTTAPDGTSCGDGDPCNGRETCVGGACQPGTGPETLGVRLLVLKRETRGPGSGSIRLTGTIHPAVPIAPATTDALTLEVRDGDGAVFASTLDHPASDAFWGRMRGGSRYLNKGASGSLSTATFRSLRSGDTEVSVRGKRVGFAGLDEPLLRPRLVIGEQCFAADLTGRCALDAKKVRCQ